MVASVQLSSECIPLRYPFGVRRLHLSLLLAFCLAECVPLSLRTPEWWLRSELSTECIRHQPPDEPIDNPSNEQSDEVADEAADEPTDEPTDEPAEEPAEEPTDNPSYELSESALDDC
jgi:hypothetical protein